MKERGERIHSYILFPFVSLSHLRCVHVILLWFIIGEEYESARRIHALVHSVSKLMIHLSCDSLSLPLKVGSAQGAARMNGMKTWVAVRKLWQGRDTRP